MPGSDTKTQTQNSVTAPWAKAEPLLTDLLGRYGSLNTGVTGDQTSALQNLSTAAGGVPSFAPVGTDAVNRLSTSSTAPQMGILSDSLSQLQNNLGGTASGAELDPYKTPGFSTALDNLTRDITNNTKSVYAGSGRDPSGAGSFAGSLAHGLALGEAPALVSQFNQNKQNQLNASNTLFGAGANTATTGANLNQIPLSNAAQALGLVPAATGAYTLPATTQLGAASANYQQPWANLSALLQPAVSLGSLGGQQSGTATVSQPQNVFSNVLGGVSGGLGLLSFLSDSRAKDDITPVGELNDGQTVYSYRYKGDPRTQIGLLAQEVEKFVPEAVDDIGGLLAVDYGKATERAAQMEAR